VLVSRRTESTLHAASAKDSVIHRLTRRVVMKAPIFVFLCVSTVVILITGTWPFLSGVVLPDTTWGLYSKEFFEHLLAEAHGALFDLLVVGILVLWLERRHAQGKQVKELERTIADLRYYRGSDASYRTYGIIRKLVDLGRHAIDLPEGDMHELRVEALQLNGSNVRAVNFSNSRLIRCEFVNCECDAVIFAGAELRETRFTDVRLRRSKFQGAQLKGFDFSSCVIENADFTNADLSSAIFRGVDCRGVSFKNANLRSANFKEAKNLTDEMLKLAKDARYIKR
jgi:uncharacterized protein YjbI with pentapeptide repeats